jgi:hypothetical protein
MGGVPYRATLAESKLGVENLLRDRTVAYQCWWKTVKGRDPAPDEDEWYRIEEAQQIAAGGGEVYQAASTGGPYTGSDWPSMVSIFVTRCSLMPRRSLRICFDRVGWVRLSLLLTHDHR